jgi:uncharacterized protein
VQHTKPNGEHRRGVVFISELVPRLALSIVANTFYGENYSTVPMRHQSEHDAEQRSISYQWKHRNRWNFIQVKAAIDPQPIKVNSSEEFFSEHYWGYTKRGEWTSEYEVLHRRWMIYPVLQHSVDVDFGALYGREFADLSNREPESILLAEGSPVEVRAGQRATRFPILIF